MKKLKIGKGVRLLFLIAVVLAAVIGAAEYLSDAEINKPSYQQSTTEQIA